LSSGLIKRAARTFSARARSRRAALFHEEIRPRPGERILDLGSEDGAHIAAVLGNGGYEVSIADIDADAVARGQAKYGFTPVVIGEDGRLPFPDGHFDVVFCSSVIEHATVDKAELRRFGSSRAFREAAFTRQRQLAEEIRRIGKRYFVQTPYRYFPIESHTWFPAIVVVLPRRLQFRFIDALNRFWPKKTAPDFHLLTRREMAELFPDAEILFERSAGLPKSLIAVRR
jgi:SAM-dependent methyltransferase